MRLLKILFTIGIVCSFYLNSFCQSEGREEMINKDVSVFKHFYEIFPLKNATTLDDLNNKLRLFNTVKKDSTDFGGVLYNWILTGGYVTINSKILSHNNQIVWVQSTIYKDNIKRLKEVLKQNRDIQKIFNHLFTLKINPHSFNDTVYQYTYTNQSLLKENKNSFSEFIGRQTDVYIKNCEAEFDLLNSSAYKELVDPIYKKYPPNKAITKLKDENRIDCILNIIRGNSLYGRIYAIRGLLELVKEGKYILTKDDKDLIKKVLSLDLTIVEAVYDMGFDKKYSESIPKILSVVLDDNYKYQKDTIYDKIKRAQIETQVIDRDPEYKGGYEAMLLFLKKNVIYPDSAIKKKIEGTVFVQFVVSKTGKLSHIKILRGIGGGCDEEAIRVVKLMPNWIPARGEDEAIPSMFQIPIKFSLNAH
jgi:TonB family protein